MCWQISYGCHYFQSCSAAWLYVFFTLHRSGSPHFFPHLDNLSKLVRGVTRKSIFWNNEVFISRYYYYFSISRARSTCVLHVVFFFHICCTAIAVIKSNLFLENFFQIFNPWGFLNWCIISLYGITAEANISLMRISSSHYPKKSFKNSMENKHADLKM